jgi:coenzyme F420-reducing hydrogenase beta subunit
MLKNKLIDGAFVSRQEMVDGKVSGRSFIATTEKEIKESATSIYVDFPLVKYFKDLLDFNGKVAVVMLPCQMEALGKFIEKNPNLREKVVLKICLFCSGNAPEILIRKIFDKNKVNFDEIEKVYFRKGFWRGKTHIALKDGSIRQFSYLYNICTYKNLYYHILPRCLACSDHFGYSADMSCGDVWLKEMKSNHVKHTGVVIRNDKTDAIINQMISKKEIYAEELSPKKMLMSQKRALNFKFYTSKPRRMLGKFFGIEYKGSLSEKYNIRHFLAAFLILLNIKAANNRFFSKIIFALPRRLSFIYMGLIRILLNSK